MSSFGFGYCCSLTMCKAEAVQGSSPVPLKASVSPRQPDSPKTKRTHELNLQGRFRQTAARRGGVQLSTEAVFEGLKEQFNAMEKLEDPNSGDDGLREGMRSSDIEFIRILKPGQFKDFLQIHGVPVRDYGIKELKSKSVKELWAEVVVRECTLVLVTHPFGRGLTLQRRVSVVFLEIEVQIGPQKRFLLLKDEDTQYARRSNLNTRPSKKMFDDEDAEEASWRCLHQNLGFKEKRAQQLFVIQSIQQSCETKDSAGFPGLPTTYDMHVVQLQVADPESPDMVTMGLPNGDDFHTSAKFIAHSSERTWTWCSREEFEAAKAATAGASMPYQGQLTEPQSPTVFDPVVVRHRPTGVSSAL